MSLSTKKTFSYPLLLLQIRHPDCGGRPAPGRLRPLRPERAPAPRLRDRAGEVRAVRGDADVPSEGRGRDRGCEGGGEGEAGEEEGGEAGEAQEEGGEDQEDQGGGGEEERQAAVI